MDYLALITALIVAPATVIAGVAYLARAFLSQVMMRDTENYKHQLLRDFEGFKRNLDALQFERQTKFSLMHQKRAEVIAELYGKLAAARTAIAHMTRLAKSVPSDEEDQKKQTMEERSAAAKAFNNLQEYFITKRIFLSDALATKTEQLINLMLSAFMDFDFSQGRFIHTRVDHQKWVEAWKRISDEAPVVLRELEKEFRSALGASD